MSKLQQHLECQEELWGETNAFDLEALIRVIVQYLNKHLCVGPSVSAAGENHKYDPGSRFELTRPWESILQLKLFYKLSWRQSFSFCCDDCQVNSRNKPFIHQECMYCMYLHLDQWRHIVLQRNLFFIDFHHRFLISERLLTVPSFKLMMGLYVCVVTLCTLNKFVQPLPPFKCLYFYLIL